MIPVNQSNIIDTGMVLLADVFSQFSGTPEEYVQYITASATKAFAAQTTKAPPLQIVNDSFSFANAIVAEVGTPKIIALTTELQKTEQDGVAGKVAPLIGDLIEDFKDLKGL